MDKEISYLFAHNYLNSIPFLTLFLIHRSFLRIQKQLFFSKQNIQLFPPVSVPSGLEIKLLKEQQQQNIKKKKHREELGSLVAISSSTGHGIFDYNLFLFKTLRSCHLCMSSLRSSHSWLSFRGVKLTIC